MASICELKRLIDMHDLCHRLGIRPDGKPRGGNCLYYSPVRDEKNASLSVFRRKDGGMGWKDHAADTGGSIVDLVTYAGQAGNTAEAVRWLHQSFSIPMDTEERQQTARRSREEWLADQVLRNPNGAAAYLIGERQLPEAVVQQAISARTLGYSSHCSTSRQPGEKFYGGPAAAFICRDFTSQAVSTVEYRYIDQALNGGLKSHCHGSKGPAFWCLSHSHIRSASTVVLVESPINALSVHACCIPGWAALATMGAGNLNDKDWQLLEGKRVVCAFDNDLPHEKTGLRPGAKAAWAVHEQLTARNIPCLFVDQLTDDWTGINDLNDFLQQGEQGRSQLRTALQRLEPWLIPGLPGKVEKDMEDQLGKPRLYLPSHDYSQYWKFRVLNDFTLHIKMSRDPDGNEILSEQDLCGFRVAGLSRIAIQSATATMSGEQDAQPRTVFSASVQTPRHGNSLQRKVFQDEQLHNPEHWRRFGPIYSASRFNRMLNILERATDIGARDALNYVGLAWMNGRPVLNEGPDCFFTNPEQQCPYHNLRLPTGSPHQARQVIEGYQATFKDCAALLPLIWVLGAQLKAFLGFWPHFILQANKGAGKSTLVKRIERTTAMTMFGGQSLQTEFRLLTSISHTGHPVGWEELSARRQDIIDRAVAMLQESYQFTISRRGADMTEYLLSAPVLLAGEDVPVQSLLGKVVRSDLSNRKGDLLPEDLPRFPVRDWIRWLTTLERTRVRQLFEQCRLWCAERSATSGEDDGANRMIGNYAAIYCAWQLLCEWLELPTGYGNLPDCLIGAMNSHVTETSSDREPWVWIMEIILGEIDAGNYRQPHQFERNPSNPDDTVLYLRPTHMMQHLSQTPSLRAKFDAMPIKSSNVLSRQIRDAGVCPVELRDKERIIDGRRVRRLIGLSLSELERYGLGVSVPIAPGHR